ncbi:MAG TPA: YdiU family protein [Rickettsiales bacterium]|nr:YdiU family protein [Rickettsiales bacterium]
MIASSKPFDFDNSYARLPEQFYRKLPPVPVSSPRLIAFNYVLAQELGASNASLETAPLAAIFSGNVIPEGAEPLALAYAGHQFGHFVPQLGDGRAILLGEVKDPHGIRRDIQLKGSGPTPFSRNGDGRAALGPVIREYIVSEAMHALGIRTTRSLAAVTTGEPVFRETALPGAIVTRIAASHIRIGTFEYFAARGDHSSVKLLADYTIARHYPEAAHTANPYITFFESVAQAQAALVASWMRVGFIHGVMNTDNMAVSGETIDYGPCAFMDYYDPMMVFSSIDRGGRYAFSNQPLIAQWNLARLAESLLPLFNAEIPKAVKIAEERLAAFPIIFRQYWLKEMRDKLGLFTQEEEDIALIEDLLQLMHKAEADYTVTFRLLSNAAAESDDKPLLQLFEEAQGITQWLQRWRTRLMRQPQSTMERAEKMRQANPVYIPRNHRIEQAIQAAVQLDDFSWMQRLQQVLAQPYQEKEEYAQYALPPLPSERITKTFCGT